MFMVDEGDVVRMHIDQHTAARCTRCTCTATTPWCWPGTACRRPGSPWWVDSLDVGDGETYDIAFVADNPGIWMDHCHNLPHAARRAWSRT